MQARIAVIGASGYTGLELTRLLAGHTGVALAVASSDRWVGESLAARAGVASDLRYASLEDALAQAASCDVVMLATPAEASYELVPKLRGVAHVIDLSGAFRLRDAAHYARYYGFSHARPELLAEAVYGLPELFRARLANARLVANPGCYATAIQLALAPILGLVAPGRLIVDAMSGVTGAGRKASEEYSYAEIAGDLRAYRVLRHQHTPEISQGLAQLAARDVPVTFVPHLLPVNRGILATCHAQLAPGHSAADVAAAFEARYGAEPFVSLAPSADKVALHDVVGTNKCRIGWTTGDDGELVITSAIDNLVKGAAGQAVQNLNVLLGLPEQAGLAGLRSFHP
ncbi:MAG: N-acetyl-gamma-glutamyl-phosphate reductase [Kofleriaceae bacterium]|nr:N-acetyl-gamma-glutamyl-phosphate reductase [Kofleriaceae bacterium]